MYRQMLNKIKLQSYIDLNILGHLVEHKKYTNKQIKKNFK